MITYVYRHSDPAFKCQKGRDFEHMQSIKDLPLEACPECGGSIHRMLQPVHFKDSYWNKKTDILDDAERVM